MNLIQITLAAALFFLCLWTSIFARFKGYSAACWFLGGGIIGVLVLCFIPTVGRVEGQKRIQGNRLGLLLSGLSILAAFLLRKFL
jgi:hypothetical protein